VAGSLGRQRREWLAAGLGGRGGGKAFGLERRVAWAWVGLTLLAAWGDRGVVTYRGRESLPHHWGTYARLVLRHTLLINGTGGMGPVVQL
jgi:hypothetical protein